MKNYLLLLLIAVFTFSCETAAPECDDNPAAGYLATADGKTDARDANPSNFEGFGTKYLIRRMLTTTEILI